MDITIILLIIPASEYILLFELLLIYEKAFTHDFGQFKGILPYSFEVFKITLQNLPT